LPVIGQEPAYLIMNKKIMMTVNNLLEFLRGMQAAGAGDLPVFLAGEDESWIPLSPTMIRIDENICADDCLEKTILGKEQENRMKIVTIGSF
jgi:hypothetical protein